jgi:hypothetical protein
MPGPLDPFMPDCDARERHAVTVRAPASLVYRVAMDFDLQSLPLVHAIFWLRGKLMRATPVPRQVRGFLPEMQSLGWGTLVDLPGELYVAGATCRPWLADVVFTPLSAEKFRGFAEPGVVKIAWTLECHATGPARTELATETRVVATEGGARKRFLAYWRWARFGILPIRWLLLPGIRKRAESEWKQRA